MTNVPRSKRTRFALPAHDDHRAVEAIDALLGPRGEPDADVRVEERGRGRAGATSTFGGLDPRLAFLEAVRREDERVRRYRRPAAVAVLALIPSNGSTSPGQDVERASWQLVEATTGTVRETDRVARVAAGRLHLLMPETRTRQAERVVERIRDEWETRMAAASGSLRLLCAVAAVPPGEGVAAALERAEDVVSVRAAAD
ncbi:MAG TPA: hypothetical protein VFI28_01900 [Candidatus Limnocylindrales bacterium]|nr:hypothetical protein [Candidatus Limnocylindrales bacterium]